MSWIIRRLSLLAQPEQDLAFVFTLDGATATASSVNLLFIWTGLNDHPSLGRALVNAG